MKKYFFLLLILLLPFCINATELSDIFGNYPKENHYKTQKMKKDSFFISCDTITGRWGKETISLLKEYAPNFYVAYASRNNFTDHREILSLLKENNIGFFAYDWGIETNFCNYLRERDGLDYTWAGLNMNTDVTDPCSHCQSTSAKATKEIWKTYF